MIVHTYFTSLIYIKLFNIVYLKNFIPTKNLTLKEKNVYEINQTISNIEHVFIGIRLIIRIYINSKYHLNNHKNIYTKIIKNKNICRSENRLKFRSCRYTSLRSYLFPSLFIIIPIFKIYCINFI